MQISGNTAPPLVWGSINSLKSNNGGTAFNNSVGNHAVGTGFHAGQLDGDALSSQSIRMFGDRWITGSVYKADDFSADNPIMRVVGTDVCGTTFEEFVDIRNVDPRSANFIEMLALDGYNAANGNRVDLFARAAAAGMQSQAIANGGDGDNWGSGINAFSNLDMLSPVMHLAQLQQQSGNFKAFMLLQQVIDAMNQHIFRMGA